LWYQVWGYLVPGDGKSESSYLTLPPKSNLVNWQTRNPKFIKICLTYNRVQTRRILNIVSSAAWLALQTWHLGRMIFREIQHSNISPYSTLLITYKHISTCISELAGVRSLQPNPLPGKIVSKCVEFSSFRTYFAWINKDYECWYSITDIPNTHRYKYPCKFKRKIFGMRIFFFFFLYFRTLPCCVTRDFCQPQDQ
jgi:hypothetical protein